MVVGEDGFGDLELEPPRRQAGLNEDLRDAQREIALAQLLDRDVDRHARCVIWRGPRDRSGATAAQHEIAERDDPVGFLRDRDEFVRPDRPELRVRPARQRFITVDGPGAPIEDRLVMQRQLLDLDRVGQCPRHFEAALLRGGIGFAEGQNLAASLALYLRDGEIGRQDQRFVAARICRKHCQARRKADRETLPVDPEGAGHRLDHGVADPFGVVVHILAMPQHEHEFIPAPAREHGIGRDQPGDPL